MTNPELGRRVRTGSFDTNVIDQGRGSPVILIHGSGPGVSGWANWRLALPSLAANRRVIAPDMVGFGFTDRPQGIRYEMVTWVRQALDLMDAIGVDQADIIGNSFGGAIAIALAIRYPERVRRLVLMGAAGVPFALTPGLDAVWGYKPSVQAMRELLDIFAFDRRLVTDELAQLRYDASIRPGFQETFEAMFPAPRQCSVDALASAEDEIRRIRHETLVIHGREDRVIPLSNSLTLAQWISGSQLHVFGRCGHWTQIEHAARFNGMVEAFLAEADAEGKGQFAPFVPTATTDRSK